MARNRFVAAEIDRIELSDSDWIEIKRQLNNGEQKVLEAAGMKAPIKVGDEFMTPIDWAVYEIERAAILLTDWSFRGPDDKPVKLSIDALKALHPKDFKEINDAIYKYMMEKLITKNE